MRYTSLSTASTLEVVASPHYGSHCKTSYKNAVERALVDDCIEGPRPEIQLPRIHDLDYLSVKTRILHLALGQSSL